MKATPKIVERIIQSIKDMDTFCVVGHVRPDGDCIGSQLALTLALRDAGKNVVCWNQDAVPSKLAFLDPEKLVRKPVSGQKFDCVIATDCASMERLGETAAKVENRKLLINIDHHASNTRYGQINWIAPREPSSGELIFRLLKAAGWTITKPIADCLFTAVSTDTGSFQYASTLPSSYQIAGELVKRGADLATICDEVYQSYPLARVRLLRHVYNNFKLTSDNRVAYFWLKKKDYTRTGSDPCDSEGLIDHIRSIEPVVVACVFEEIEPNFTRISLRSKSKAVDVNHVAQQFGGGGHQAAAGAKVQGTSLSVQRRVIAAVRKALEASQATAGK